MQLVVCMADNACKQVLCSCDAQSLKLEAGKRGKEQSISNGRPQTKRMHLNMSTVKLHSYVSLACLGVYKAICVLMSISSHVLDRFLSGDGCGMQLLCGCVPASLPPHGTRLLPGKSSFWWSAHQLAKVSCIRLHHLRSGARRTYWHMHCGRYRDLSKHPGQHHYFSVPRTHI